MAVYKIFPEKSATLYSFYPTLNTGLDEILELSTYKSINSTDEVSRPIIQFPSDQISDIVLNKISGSKFDAYIKLYLAQASEIPLSYTIYVHTLSQNWNMGTGRLGNSPSTINGVSWEYSTEYGNTKWISGSFPFGTTGSYNESGSEGGGTWLTNPVYTATQSFNFASDKDIEAKVTNTVLGWVSGSINNYGFILKHSSSLEFNDSSKFELKYFSDTSHTIYPPALELRWDDSSYSTGSLSIINNGLFALTLGNNKGQFQQDSVQRFRVNIRDIYPPVGYRTTLSYANSKALPSSSYWSIKDLDTEEIVVDYDTSYTKISCDSNGNYFDLYMNGLEPERYYKILIKTVLADGEVVVSDKDYIFKVIR